MADDRFSTTIVNNIFNIAVAIALAAASWSIKEAIETTQAIADLKGVVNVIHTELQEHRAAEQKEVHTQNTLKKHWKLHVWELGEIQELRRKSDLPVTRWPDFSE